MKKAILVFDRLEAVTIRPAPTPGKHRVIWHPSDGGPDEFFEVTASSGDKVEQAVAKELCKRKAQ
jgi:hypothetical protein